jgi:hypothetical protein
LEQCDAIAFVGKIINELQSRSVLLLHLRFKWIRYLFDIVRWINVEIASAWNAAPDNNVRKLTGNLTSIFVDRRDFNEPSARASWHHQPLIPTNATAVSLLLPGNDDAIRRRTRCAANFPFASG